MLPITIEVDERVCGKKKLDVILKPGDLFEDLESFFTEMYRNYLIVNKKDFRKEVENFIFSIDKNNVDLKNSSTAFFGIVEKYLEKK